MVEKNYDCSVAELSELVENEEVNVSAIKPNVLGVFYLKEPKNCYDSCSCECENYCACQCETYHDCPEDG